MMRKGFTLIELTVVIAIIVVLSAIIVPNLSGSVSKASNVEALANAKQVYAAALQVAALNTETPGALTAGSSTDDDTDAAAIKAIIGEGYTVTISSTAPTGDMDDNAVCIVIDNGKPTAAYFESSDVKYPEDPEE